MYCNTALNYTFRRQRHCIKEGFCHIREQRQTSSRRVCQFSAFVTYILLSMFAGTDLMALLVEQRNHSSWGQYVNSLLDNAGFEYPK